MEIIVYVNRPSLSHQGLCRSLQSGEKTCDFARAKVLSMTFELSVLKTRQTWAALCHEKVKDWHGILLTAVPGGISAEMNDLATGRGPQFSDVNNPKGLFGEPECARKVRREKASV